MPHDKFVQKLTEILEPIDPLYEYPVDSTNAESLDNIEESTDQILNSVNGSNTEINTGVGYLLLKTSELINYYKFFLKFRIIRSFLI